MLYTGRGDKGTSTLYLNKKRLPKDHAIFEALGSLDELNSYLGILAFLLRDKKLYFVKNQEKVFYEKEIKKVQNKIFCLQAELAGADKKINKEDIKDLELIINYWEEAMPKVKSFFLPGGNEVAAHLDFCRTLVRRAERRFLTVYRKKKNLTTYSIPYLNRLSSFLYAMARYLNYQEGYREEKLTY